jgi:folate-binding protein YgfZ
MFSLDDYWTLRKTAAVVRHSDRGVIAVTGRDRATWLQGLLTNDVLALQEGQSCYSAYLTPQGRMIADMQVLALADRIWLDVPAPLAAALRDRLDGLIFAEDAQVSVASDSIAIWGVYGPQAQATLKGDPATLKGCLHTDSSLGIPGLALYLTASDTLPAAVAALPQASLDTLDVLRIEAGVPKFLVDMSEDTIPLEAGIEDRAISFTKGCYVGQEVIIRVTHRGGGRVARRLVQWKDSSHTVTAGATIQSGDRAIGRVTSAAFSPAHDALIGLGYVHRDFVDNGTAITVHDAGGSFDATIV